MIDIEALADVAAAAGRAAALVAAHARDAVATRVQFVRAGSGGKTPWHMLRALAALVVMTAGAAAEVSVGAMGRNTAGVGWVTAGSRVLVSRDGGASWADVTPPLAGTPQGVHATFVEGRVGWVAIVTGDTAGPFVQVFRSVDAGGTWEAADARPMGFDVAAVRIAAISASHAWVMVQRTTGSNFSEGVLLRTRDGGRTWESLSDPPAAGDITFASADHGWLVGGASGREVLETSDGGSSWQSLGRWLAPHLSETDEVSISLPSIHDGSLRFVVAADSGARREARMLTRAPGARDFDAQLVNRVVQRATVRGDAGEAPVARAISDLLVHGPATGRWSARGVALSSRDVAAQIEASSPRDAWVLLRDGNCATFKRDCVQTSTLLATDDGGRTVVDVTPRAPGAASRTTGASPRDVALSENKGFDKCTAASVSSLQTWWNESPYRDVNAYIGGISRGCSQPLLNAEWVRDVFAQGWRVIPTWVGYQAPCTSCTSCRNRVPLDTAEAEAEGVREADRASDVAQGLGLGPQTIVYFDMEAYASTDRPCRDAVGAFVNGWSRRMRERGHLAGVYGSATNASQDWTGIQHRPDAVWIGKWDLRETVWGLTPLSDAEWPNHQRLHQYRGGHDETWGGVTFNIDNDIEDGPVAALAGVASPDTSGPELTVGSPVEGSRVGSRVVVSGSASDAGRGASGIASVTVNGVRADGGEARGSDVARWRVEITLGLGPQGIVIEARDASGAQNATRASVRVIVDDGGAPPPSPLPPPSGPTTVVAGLSDPRAVIADGAVAWWIDGTGRLGQSDLLTSVTTIVTEALVQPTALARGDGPAILVADARGIWRFPGAGDVLPGVEPQALVPDEARVTSLAVAGEFLYWADATRGEIRRLHVPSGETVVLAGGTPEPASLRVADGRLFWIERAAAGAVRSMTLDGEEPVRLAEGANTPALSVGDGRVVWGQVDEDGVAGRLRRLDAGVDEPRTLIDGVRRPWDVARLGPSVFWVEAVGDGVLWRAAADGTSAERLVSALAEPIACVPVENGLLVIERAGGEPGAGRILRVGLGAAVPVRRGAR